MDILTLSVTAKELGDVLGLTDRRIRQLAEEGVLDRVERGRYPLANSVQAYLAAQAAEDDELREERIKLVRAQRRRLELQNEATEASEADFAFQDTMISTLTMYWHLQSRQVAGWLYGELSMREPIKHEARAIAGAVENWLIALRSETDIELRAAAAKSRRDGRVIANFDDLHRFLGKAPVDED
jgi:hypothetical protein